ncbi:MAG: insulinase family protein [Crocinitomicaceae bacterium]|nr:insulinase family protein [Flavobacteriales bacterium]NQZ35705.1 insulinase family protein [Crocinitomicaceae bacterium]
MKMITHFIAPLVVIFLAHLTFAQSYTYEAVENDPTGTRIYTLDNGLKVYLSINKDEPRVHTYITVKTGSKNDPADVTGLAHYLEHMVFKGTSKYGTANWEKEKILLKQISDLYEKQKAEKDSKKKKAIYAEIDSVSNEAAKYAIANEYDKMVSGLGAQRTNAYTSLERTVYVNDIPATELEKWMYLESERFSELVLRLFHTELEAVYEEFNMGQDSDYRKAHAAMNKLLFPTHPYGTQTTIGEGEHLRNPSMEKIHSYFDKYYVPNNMAVILSGDLDFDQTIALVDKYFGKMKSKVVTPRKMPIESPQTRIKTVDVYGPMEEWVNIGYRVGGYHTEDAMMTYLATSVLCNRQAGLIDLNLVQSQKVIKANSFSNSMHDYSTFQLKGTPKEGQTLEQVKDLLIAEVEKLKAGEFDDKLLESIIKNVRKDRLRNYEYNWARVNDLSDAFIMEADWKDYVNFFDDMAKITKEQLVAWTNKHLSNNYCVVYKRTGEDNDVYKVDKPQITPIELNRDDQSTFYKQFDQMESLRLKPEFVDFDKALKRKEIIADVPFYYVENKTNDLFTLFFDMDENLKKDKKVKVAIEYLSFLGTEKYSASELKQRFFELGVQYYVSSTSVYITGLSESFEEALSLFEHLLLNCEVDENALENLIDDIKKKRENAKKSKGRIMFGGMRNYAKYGAKNEFNNVFSDAELEVLSGQELVDVLHSLTTFKHSVFFYGKATFEDAFSSVKKYHILPKSVKAAKEVKFPELETDKNIVYIVDYDMVQTQLLMLSKAEEWNPELLPSISMFNSYFGSGLSSIVFQELRESKALAYSSYAYMSSPYKKGESHYVNVFIGTQVNKLGQATSAIMELMNDMPKADLQFNESKVAALKKIESNRTTKSEIYWNYRAFEKAELSPDTPKRNYEAIGNMTIDDLETYFNENIKGRNYVFCVIGKKADMDLESLKQLGEVKELSLEQLFGY